MFCRVKSTTVNVGAFTIVHDGALAHLGLAVPS